MKIVNTKTPLIIIKVQNTIKYFIFTDRAMCNDYTQVAINKIINMKLNLFRCYQTNNLCIEWMSLRIA